MIAKQIITETIPNLLPTDTVSRAINLMETYKVSHLPIVFNNDFLGLISETDLLDLNNNDAIINNKLIINDKFILENQHIYDVINSFVDDKLSLLPVLNNKQKYIGSIVLPDLLSALKQTISIEDLGGIIVLETAYNDYSLTEIANIVESENIKIISLYINTKKQLHKIHITIKLNTDDILPIIKSFERYNYNIKAVFSNNKTSNEFYNDRLDELLFYLNI